MRPGPLVALAFGLLMAGGAVAAPPAFEEADLTAKPSGADVMAVFPANLRYENILAEVTMRCTVDAAGKARRCETIRETPYGLGFGEVGTGLMERQGKFKPRRVDGQPVDGGQVEFTLNIWGRSGGNVLLPDPDWAAAPTFEDIAAAWPEGHPGQEAVVVLRCRLRKASALEKCRTLGGEKAPAEAVLAMTDQFRVRLTPEENRYFTTADVILSVRLVNPAGNAAAERRVKVPDWTAYPDSRALQAVYPEAAAEAGVRAGRGVADCLVAADGSLTDCRMADEKPASLGFGDAAVRVAGQMKLNLWSGDGRPTVGARIRLPVEFHQAGTAAN